MCTYDLLFWFDFAASFASSQGNSHGLSNSKLPLDPRLLCVMLLVHVEPKTVIAVTVTVKVTGALRYKQR